MGDREKFLKGYQDGKLLDMLLEARSQDPEELVGDLIALHNEERIDLVNAFTALTNNDRMPDFFFLSQILEQALPHLKAPIAPVMRCVLQVYCKAGHDMAAGTVVRAFIDFCAKEASRPSDALAQIKANPGEFKDLLAPTLIAGSRIDRDAYLAHAVRLSLADDIELRKRAVFSIGRLDWPKGTSIPDSAFAALERVAAGETDENVRANAARSACSLVMADNAQAQRGTAIVSSVLSKGGVPPLHVAAEAFGLHTSDLPPALLDTLIEHLASVDPANKGTIDHIDLGLMHLLKHGASEKALLLLERLLLAHPDQLTVAAFDGTSSDILGNRDLLAKVATRWLARGDRILCKGVEALCRQHHGTDLLLKVDTSELEPGDPDRVLYVARKSVGYLFPHPLSAASMVVSLMKATGDDKALDELGFLLFDPLLLNFSGKLRQYLAEQAKTASGKAKDAIDAALKALEDYLNVLRSAGSLPALHPSEGQREAWNRHMSRLMADAYKAAEATSILRMIARTSVVLYGRTSIHYYPSEGATRRMETPLEKHGVEWEFPRLSVLDPLGLEHRLLMFKAEGPPT